MNLLSINTQVAQTGNAWVFDILDPLYFRDVVFDFENVNILLGLQNDLGYGVLRIDYQHLRAFFPNQVHLVVYFEHLELVA